MTNQEYEKSCVDTASPSLFERCNWKTSSELVCDWSNYSDFNRGQEYEVFTGYVDDEPVCWVVADNGEDIKLRPANSDYVSSDGMLGFLMPKW